MPRIALLAIALIAQVPSSAPRLSPLQCLTPEQAEILAHMEIVYDDAGAKTIRFTGVNVQIVNGTGSTIAPGGYGGGNGLGNLIVGYNEPPTGALERSGSHNLIVGTGHSWQGSACLIAGENHRVFPDSTWLPGGFPDYAVVVGGQGSEATHEHAAVFGGYANRASGPWSTVVGGHWNNARGRKDLIAGGWTNRTADGTGNVVVGGSHNTARATWEEQIGGTITGGENCLLSDNAAHSTIGGGNGTYLNQPYTWAANGLVAP